MFVCFLNKFQFKLIINFNYLFTKCGAVRNGNGGGHGVWHEDDVYTNMVSEFDPLMVKIILGDIPEFKFREEVIKVFFSGFSLLEVVFIRW